MFGPPASEPFVPARWLHDGDSVAVGRARSRCAIARATRRGTWCSTTRRPRAFVGDVLFAGGVGRTDLPGGDHDTLISSITQRQWPMGDHTVFIPGHGPEQLRPRAAQQSVRRRHLSASPAEWPRRARASRSGGPGDG